MSEVKKVPGALQLTAYYKGDWTQQISITSGGSAYDLTGATATFILYEMNGTAALSLATGGSGITHTSAGGVVTITATNAQIVALATQDYRYEFIVTLSTGRVWPMLDGFFTITEDGTAAATGATVTVTIENDTVTLTLPAGTAGVGVPAGGTTGQSLTKASNTDYDTEWTTVSGGGGGTWGSITGTLSDQTDLQTALDGKVDENAGITGATKTKITYDAKGLVTAGADATTADIADSADKRYVTDAQLTVIGNTSGTNTGDQTNVTGNAGTVTVADAGGDTTTWVLLGTAQTGSLAPATDAGLTYNATTNALTATNFVGALTGNADTVTGFSGTSSGTNTGDQTIQLTGDVTGSGTGSFAATIANSAVTLAKMADMATASLLGRNTAGTGVPEVLSASTAKTLLSLDNVENTALSTWAGTTNINTLGTISTGVWSGTEIAVTKGGTGLTALGTALQQLRVNAGATALEYFTPAAASGDITDGGNTTGATVVIGTNDANALELETNNVTRLSITGGASTGGAVTVTNVTANTSTVQDVLTLQTNSSGTAAAGFGGGILFQGESSTTDNRDMARLASVWTTATDASRRSELIYSAVSGGGAISEICKFTTSGISNSVNFFTVGGTSNSLILGGSSGTVTVSSSSASGSAVRIGAGNTINSSAVSIGGATNLATSGNKPSAFFDTNFAPTSGTATWSAMHVNATINQTGGANGITRGLYIVPTLTAIADFRAIDIAADHASAKGIYQTGTSTTNNFVGATAFGSTSAPVATALVEMTSTTQGFLPPRMDSTARDAISSPATGLIIYNTSTNKINFYNGSAWEAVTSA